MIIAHKTSIRGVNVENASTATLGRTQRSAHLLALSLRKEH